MALSTAECQRPDGAETPLAADVAATDDGPMHIFRVIVRGRFGELAAEQREALRRAADDHDVVTAPVAFTPAGTFTYDKRVDFFSHRVEVRVRDDEADGPDAARSVAFERAVEIAAADLRRRGLTWRHLEPVGSNMADVWH